MFTCTVLYKYEKLLGTCTVELVYTCVMTIVETGPSGCYRKVAFLLAFTLKTNTDFFHFLTNKHADFLLYDMCLVWKYAESSDAHQALPYATIMLSWLSRRRSGSAWDFRNKCSTHQKTGCNYSVCKWKLLHRIWKASHAIAFWHKHSGQTHIGPVHHPMHLVVGFCSVFHLCKVMDTV